MTENEDVVFETAVLVDEPVPISPKVIVSLQFNKGIVFWVLRVELHVSAPGKVVNEQDTILVKSLHCSDSVKHSSLESMVDSLMREFMPSSYGGTNSITMMIVRCAPDSVLDMKRKLVKELGRYLERRSDGRWVPIRHIDSQESMNSPVDESLIQRIDLMVHNPG